MYVNVLPVNDKPPPPLAVALDPTSYASLLMVILLLALSHATSVPLLPANSIVSVGSPLPATKLSFA